MNIQEKLAEIGETDFLSIRVFTTRGWSDEDAAMIMMHGSFPARVSGVRPADRTACALKS